MIERSADYSVADARAWREAQEQWSASESWIHPDPDADDDAARLIVDRFLDLTIFFFLGLAAIGGCVLWWAHGV